MKCPKCGNENESNARFCKKCGQPLKKNSIVDSDILNKNSKPILITAIAILAIIAIGIGLYASGIFVPDLPLETHDFGAFTIDIPQGSKFVVSDSVTTNPKGVVVSYENKGKHRDDATFVIVGTGNSDVYANDGDNELIEDNNGIKIYKSKEADSTGTCYMTFEDKNNAQCSVIGYDLNTVKRMAKTFKVNDMNKLKQNATPLNTNVQSSSSTQSSPSSPSSISILGGSFSTGSAESDKTYARINVGTAHAGENVIVQIWYSRDGNTLNHGNMVPASVHSDGYLEIASADAYHYYPDHATINIYDTNSHLLTSKSVNLSPSSGTQTF